MDLKKKIRIALGIETELAYQGTLTDGTVIVSSGEELSAGADVSILAEDGSQMPLPVGDYETEDGVTFSVTEEGIVAEVGGGDEEESEEEVEAAEEEAPAEDEVSADEVVDVIAEVTAEVAEAINAETPEEVTPEIAEAAAEVAVAVIVEKAEAVAEGEELTSDHDKELDREKRAPGVKDLKRTKKRKYSKLESEVNFLKRKLKKLGKRPASKPVSSSKFASATRKKLSKVEFKQLSTTERIQYMLGQIEN